MQTAYQKKQYDKCSKCPRLFIVQKKTGFGTEKHDKECPQCRELRLFNIKVTDPGYLGKHEPRPPFVVTPLVKTPPEAIIANEKSPLANPLKNENTAGITN